MTIDISMLPAAAAITTEEWRMMVVLLTVSCIGVVSNSIVIVAMYRMQRMRRHPLNLLLVAVQVSDLLIQLGVVINLARSLQLGISPGFLPHCQLFGVTAMLWSAVSYYCLTAVAISRYYLIVKSKRWGLGRYVAMVCCSIVLAMVNVATMVSSVSKSSSGAGRLVCQPAWTRHGDQLVATIPIVIGGALAAIVSTLCYNRISHHIKQAKLAVRTTLNSSKQVHELGLHDIRAVNRLVWVNIVFLLGWTLYKVEMIYEVSAQEHVPALYDQIAVLLVLVTLAAAPWMWVRGNRQLTEAVKSLFGLSSGGVVPEWESRTRRISQSHIVVDPMLNVHVSSAGEPMDYCVRPRPSQLSRSASILVMARQPSMSVSGDTVIRSARIRKHQSADDTASYRKMHAKSVQASPQAFRSQLQSHDSRLQIPCSPRASQGASLSPSGPSSILLAAPPRPRIVLKQVNSPGRSPARLPSYQASPDLVSRSPGLTPAMWYSPLVSSDGARAASETIVTSSSAEALLGQRIPPSAYNATYQLSGLHGCADASPDSQPRTMSSTTIASQPSLFSYRARSLPELPSSIHRRLTDTTSLPAYLGSESPGLYSATVSSIEAMFPVTRTGSQTSDKLSM